MIICKTRNKLKETQNKKNKVRIKFENKSRRRRKKRAKMNLVMAEWSNTFVFFSMTRKKEEEICRIDR